jgi:hypothetical protein
MNLINSVQCIVLLLLGLNWLHFAVSSTFHGYDGPDIIPECRIPAGR